MPDVHQISPAQPTSQSESTSTARVPALLEDGSNWILFREQFLSVVLSKGLRRYLEGTERAPQPPTAPGVDPDADENYEKAVDQWTANHATVKSLLFQTVPESLKLEIATHRRAVDMWRVVTSRYDTLNAGDYVQAKLMSDMHTLKCEEGADPRPILAQLATLRMQYLSAGGTLSDEQYKVLIMGTLPMSYRPTIRAVTLSAHAAGRQLTAALLLTSITEMARDEHALDQDPSSASALAAGAHVRCFNCKELGHVIADCTKKGGGKEGQGGAKRR